MTNQILHLYDNQRLSDFFGCARYYLFRHVYHWAPEGRSAPLAFGGSWHTALEVIYGRHKELYTTKASRQEVIRAAYEAFIVKWVEEGWTHPDEMSPDDIEAVEPRTPMIAHEMLHSYVDAREHIITDPSFELLGIEEPFAVPLDSQRGDLFYVGRLDTRIRWRRKMTTLEHKTSSLYRKGGVFKDEFIDGFSLNSQVTGYQFAMRMMYGNEADAVWIDASLVHKSVHDGHKIIPIDQNEDILNEWLWTTHTWIDAIRANKEILAERSKLDTPYLAAFPKRTSNCINKFGRCPFFDTCRGVPNPAKLEGKPPIGFKYSPWSPFNVIKLEKIGFSVEGSGEPLLPSTTEHQT